MERASVGALQGTRCARARHGTTVRPGRGPLPHVRSGPRPRPHAAMRSVRAQRVPRVPRAAPSGTDSRSALAGSTCASCAASRPSPTSACAVAAPTTGRPAAAALCRPGGLALLVRTVRLRYSERLCAACCRASCASRLGSSRLCAHAGRSRLAAAASAARTQHVSGSPGPSTRETWDSKGPPPIGCCRPVSTRREIPKKQDRE